LIASRWDGKKDQTSQSKGNTKMYRSIGCLFAAALFAGPAFAQDQATSTASPAPAATSATMAQAAPAAVPVSDPVVCRTQPITGSRLGNQRVCAKQSEWERRSVHDRQQLDKVQSTGNALSGN
jgi:hypothetical protein